MTGRRGLLVLATLGRFAAVLFASWPTPSGDPMATPGERTPGPIATPRPEGTNPLLPTATIPQEEATSPAPDLPAATAVAAPASEPTREPTAQPTREPSSTATPAPTATPEPTVTPVDDSPIVIPGDGWNITENDVARLHAFVEEVHGLAFTAPVGVDYSDDIGAGFAAGIDLLPEPEWRFYVALGLIGPEADRDAVSDFRRDRIRGVCCESDEGGLTVIVEPNATKLETEVILVHELVHALHWQHANRFRGPRPGAELELPIPYFAIVEAVPQLVAFRYLESAPDDIEAIVRPELPIVKPEQVDMVGPVPAALLNFGYFDAPEMVEAVYAERGTEGMSSLLHRPPETTEQLLFPEKWFDEEVAVAQEPIPVPAGGSFVNDGRIGVVLLEWLIGSPGEVDPDIRSLLSNWAGDRWTMYRFDGRDCLAVVVQMDTAEAATDLAELLSVATGQFLAPDPDYRIRFDTCEVLRSAPSG